MTAFFSGDVGSHRGAIGNLMRENLANLCGTKFVRWRLLADYEWKNCNGLHDLDLPRLLAAPPNVPCRGIELSGDAPGSLQPATLRWVDMQDFQGRSRASHLHLLLDAAAGPRDLVECASILLDRIPWCWGSAGLIFVRESGPTYASYKRIVHLAKRYWGIDVHDCGLLQNLASAGILGINWLMMLGKAFCTQRGFDVATVLADHQKILGHRSCKHGSLIAAGPRPLSGDVNIGEDLSAYRAMHRALKPLLLPPPEGLMGPYTPNDVVEAWSNRFIASECWQSCRVDQI